MLFLVSSQVVNDALAPYASSPDFPDRARQFLMKWSFYRFVIHLLLCRHSGLCQNLVLALMEIWLFVEIDKFYHASHILVRF